MKYTKILTMSAVLVSMNIYPVPLYSPRSQSVNAAREMVGWQADINRCDEDHIYGSFNITPEYTQTFRRNSIATCLFGSDLHCIRNATSVLDIQGSLVPDRKPRAWLADYFGLPTDFNGSISFKPRISNFLADINFFLGLDEIASGLYFRVHAPIVHTRWDLNASELSTQGTNGYPAGYFSSNAVPNINLLTTALDYFSGKKVPTNLTNDNTVTTGNTSLPSTVVFQKLACSRWADCHCGSLTRTRLSDIEFAFGWNFWCNEDHLIGLQLRASAPTGNKPDSCYLFEPIIGSGGHWKVGMGLNFHSIFFRSSCESNYWGFYVDANIQHMFEATHKRCFDLCTSGTSLVGENSRYMLAQRLEPVTFATESPLLPANDADLQFASEFAPVANITSFHVDVNVSVEADIAAKFAYTHGNFEFDLGYEFYGRSCEKIEPKGNCIPTPLDGKTWALKGDSQVFGFLNAGLTTRPVALAATQSSATIHSGVNQFVEGSVRQNSERIDNAQLSTNATVAPAVALPLQRSSNPPIGLSITNVNFAGTRAISHKLFAHFNYAWRDNEDWTPYLGIGGEAEFGNCGPCGNGCRSCKDACNCTDNSLIQTCVSCVPSQWGLWLKGGVSFN